MDAIGAIQAVVGIALFLAAGYSCSLVFFKKNEADLIERIVYSLTFSVTIPPLAIFFLNFLLRLPINALTVYFVYLAVSGAGYAYHMIYGEGKAHKG
ncbi:MAG: hypothetical protein V1835_02460 [Candidatus Micrarchaeota archaeon]